MRIHTVRTSADRSKGATRAVGELAQHKSATIYSVVTYKLATCYRYWIIACDILRSSLRLWPLTAAFAFFRWSVKLVRLLPPPNY